MFVVGLFGFIMDNIGLFKLPTEIVVIIGLILSELTKFFNSNLRELK